MKSSDGTTWGAWANSRRKYRSATAVGSNTRPSLVQLNRISPWDHVVDGSNHRWPQFVTIVYSRSRYSRIRSTGLNIMTSRMDSQGTNTWSNCLYSTGF